MRALLVLGNGSMIVSGRSRRCDALIRRGWIAPENPSVPNNAFRITPAGLRALADAVELYGLPSFKGAA